MWTIDYENVTLYNQDTGASVDFDYSKAADLYLVRVHKPICAFGKTREAINFIHALAELLAAVSLDVPPVEPDDKSEPF